NQDYKYYENGAVFKSYSEINDYLDISKKIDEMSLTVQELERNITKYSERDATVSKMRAIRLSVDKLEGSGCGGGQFQCGGLFSRCIPSFLTCDGYKDCENGEDEEHCDRLFEVGDEWTCHVIYDHCTPHPIKDVYSMVKVTEHKVTNYFKAQSEVTIKFKASLISPWMQTTVFGYCQGHYVYGLRTLDYGCSLQPSVQMTGIFEGDNKNICHVTMYRLGGEVRILLS
ncbi:hypothetical protein LSH36_45g02011, partial [Paralvinella palmiformis]